MDRDTSQSLKDMLTHIKAQKFFDAPKTTETNNNDWTSRCRKVLNMQGEGFEYAGGGGGEGGTSRCRKVLNMWAGGGGAQGS